MNVYCAGTGSGGGRCYGSRAGPAQSAAGRAVMRIAGSLLAWQPAAVLLAAVLLLLIAGPSVAEASEGAVGADAAGSDAAGAIVASLPRRQLLASGSVGAGGITGEITSCSAELLASGACTRPAHAPIMYAQAQHCQVKQILTTCYVAISCHVTERVRSYTPALHCKHTSISYLKLYRQASWWAWRRWRRQPGGCASSWAAAPPEPRCRPPMAAQAMSRWAVTAGSAALRSPRC